MLYSPVQPDSVQRAWIGTIRVYLTSSRHPCDLPYPEEGQVVVVPLRQNAADAVHSVLCPMGHQLVAREQQKPSYLQLEGSLRGTAAQDEFATLYRYSVREVLTQGTGCIHVMPGASLQLNPAEHRLQQAELQRPLQLMQENGLARQALQLRIVLVFCREFLGIFW